MKGRPTHKTHEQRIAEAFDAGREAFKTGWAPKDCPYKFIPERAAWARGYRKEAEDTSDYDE